MKIFITGSTGYIGGSVAKALLDAGHQVLGLVRSPKKVQALRDLGVVPVLGNLDDFELLIQCAQASDAVINTANSDHLSSVQAFIEALSGTGKIFIHTSGSSIVGDDVEGNYESNQIFNENTPFIPMRIREDRVSLNTLVCKAGVENTIRSMVIAPSMIYGDALGLPALSDQIPKLVAFSKKSGAGIHIGKGVNRWSNVHIKDLTELYLLMLEKGSAGALFYAENGEESLLNIAQSISIALGFGGKTKSVTLADAIAEFGDWARYAIASNSRIRAANAKSFLGWRPKQNSILKWIESYI